MNKDVSIKRNVMEQNAINDFKQIIYLFLARNSRRKKDLMRARRRLEQALALDAHSDYFVLGLAFDASLRIAEDDLEGAKAAFAKCHITAEPESSSDQSYASAYCELFLAMWDESNGFDKINEHGQAAHKASLAASRFSRLLLGRVPMDKLKEICGHRTSQSTSVVTAATVLDLGKLSDTTAFEF